MATADCTARREREDRTIARALQILERRAKYEATREALDSHAAARRYLRLRLHSLEREEFWCVWLDAQHRQIETECMFVGSLTETSVYPREVVRRALHHNAAAVILAHNHPSGASDPSTADELLTRAIKDVLSLVNVRVLDHFIIGAAPLPTSFAERGLL